MITVTCTALELIYTGIFLFIRIIVWIKNRKIDFKREALMLLLYIYLFILIRFIIFPMERVDGRVQPIYFDIKNLSNPKLNLVPFIHMFDGKDKAKTYFVFFGNIGMFIPPGIIFSILFKRLDSVIKAIDAGILLSLSIELLQLLVFERTTDIDDIILNTLGVVIGYLIYRLCFYLFDRSSRKKENKTDTVRENAKG